MGEIRFEIRDSGPGIAPEELTRVFDCHWSRGDGTGSGLGLYIAKAVVEAHGGRIGRRAKTERRCRSPSRRRSQRGGTKPSLLR